MNISRRAFLQMGSTLPVLGALPNLTLAEMSIGSARLTTVSDGNLTLPGSFLFDAMPQDELTQILNIYELSGDQITPECNLTLYRDGTHTVLFDAGAGADFMPTAGKLVDSLETLDLAPEDVTHVVFTHAHPDHIWGVLDEFDDPLFYEATHIMGRAEWDYWWNPETVNEIGEERAAFAVGARRRMEAIEDTVQLIDPDQEILPGIASLASYGHTPGHMSYEVRQAGASALIAGDAIGNHHVAFHRPDWRSGSDQDPDTAIATRRMLLDRLASEDMALIGFHLPGGGMGRVARTEDGYRFVQEDE